jgi:copper transport protein
VTAPPAPLRRGVRSATAVDATAVAVGLLVAGLTATCLLASGFGVYVVNGIALVAALLTAGLALFAALPGAATATLHRLLPAAAATTFAFALLSVPFAIMTVDGRGLTGLGDSLARDVVLRSGDYGSVLMRCAGAIVVVLAVRLAHRSGQSRALLLVGAITVAGSFLLTGHVRTHGPVVLVVVCALAHVLAAAAWFGGVVGLGVTLRTVHGAAAARLLTTFSTLMTGVLTMLLAGGIGLALLYLPSASALVDTAYGQVLLVKLAIVVGLLVLSAANHRRLVPLTTHGRADAVAVLRLNVAVEQIGLLAVVLITDILVRQNPGG